MIRVGLTGRLDPLIRRKQLEHAHPEVTIVPPGTLNDPWRAIVRPGTAPGDPAATTLSSWQLAGLMDQLDALLPKGGDTDQESMQTAEQAAPLKCLCCMMTDPPPTQTCHQGRDHRVGFAAGCPGCGRLAEACARRPCSAMRLASPRRGSRAGRAVAAVLSPPAPPAKSGDR